MSARHGYGWRCGPHRTEARAMSKEKNGGVARLAWLALLAGVGCGGSEQDGMGQAPLNMQAGAGGAAPFAGSGGIGGIGGVGGAAGAAGMNVPIAGAGGVSGAGIGGAGGA